MKLNLILPSFFLFQVLLGNSPVDRTFSLKAVSSDFGLADGPSWQGWHLTVPDPKAGQVKRFIPKQDKWNTIATEKRFSASFHNNGVTYFADHGGGAIRSINQSNEWKLVYQEDLEKDKRRRPNDLVVDRSGGIFYTLTLPGEVVYISPKGKATTVAKGIQTPNGLILSPDEKTLYVSEYVPKNIISFAVGESGQLSDRALFAKMDDGLPDLKGADGMCVDRAGNIYCAGPKDIWIWNADGKLVDKIACPERAVNCAFGGPNLQELYLAGFGGVHMQKMKVAGVPAQPPAKWPENLASKPSVEIPKGVTQLIDLTYAQYGARKMLADVFLPKGKGPHSGVLIIHGGGWAKGDKMKFRSIGLEMAKRGYVSMAMEYRLSGESHFPANIHDCHAAVRYLRANAKEYKLDPDRIGVVGGSAGGHLAGLLATTSKVKTLHGDGGNEKFSSKVQAAVVMSGPMRISTGRVAEKSMQINNAQSFAVKLFGGTIQQLPQQYEAADAHLHIDKDTPPILFQYGGAEDSSEIQPTVEKLEKLEIPVEVLTHYKDGKHGCWNNHPWFMPMMEDIDAWFQEHL